MAKLELWPELTPTLMYLYLDGSISGGQLPGNLSAILPKLTTFSCFGCNLEVGQTPQFALADTSEAGWNLNMHAACRGLSRQVPGLKRVHACAASPDQALT